INAIILKKSKDNQFIKANVKIVDLSETGCLIEIIESEMLDDMDVETKFFVNFKILDKSLELDCIAKNIRTKNETYQVGTQFIGEYITQKETISSFISMLDSQDFRI
ncbi:MAG: PilZ domain-containing protein, partial [Thermodesulfovibrionales bacterium]|nr:PilZ domain-containing protein [Thermodesulfovibrionales bacterium]